MAYFKINSKDFSDIVAELQITYAPVYNSQTTASGDTVIDIINEKRKIDVKIIPIDDTKMAEVLAAIKDRVVSLSYREPNTNELVDNITCFISSIPVDYYRINSKVYYNKTSLKFQEL